MFGFFRKKKEDKTKVAIDTICMVMGMQLELGGIGSGAKLRASDEWAMGYLYGLNDSFLQLFEIDGDIECLSIMAVTFEKVLGPKGPLLFTRSLDFQERELYRSGMLVGGQDAVDFVNSKTPPMRLASYLRETQPVKESTDAEPER